VLLLTAVYVLLAQVERLCDAAGWRGVVCKGGGERGRLFGLVGGAVCVHLCSSMALSFCCLLLAC
jgi:hypothetical protein